MSFKESDSQSIGMLDLSNLNQKTVKRLYAVIRDRMRKGERGEMSVVFGPPEEPRKWTLERVTAKVGSTGIQLEGPVVSTVLEGGRVLPAMKEVEVGVDDILANSFKADDKRELVKALKAQRLPSHGTVDVHGVRFNSLHKLFQLRGDVRGAWEVDPASRDRLLLRISDRTSKHTLLVDLKDDSRMPVRKGT